MWRRSRHDDDHDRACGRTDVHDGADHDDAGSNDDDSGDHDIDGSAGDDNVHDHGTDDHDGARASRRADHHRAGCR